MKRILFVRHAKSSWSDMSLPDNKRPLNKRGVRDAPDMAQRCKDYGIDVDLIISSSAVRAFSTAEEFHKCYQLNTAIQVESYLYHGDPSDFEEALCGVDDSVKCVAIFGHNPGITYLANELDSNEYIDNVPTTGVLVGEIDIDNWEDFSIPKTRLKDFLYPKQIK